tara:strand:- start:166 stop:459 length:294 start_codon:yes stop_codon:yes gene_type:complete
MNPFQKLAYELNRSAALLEKRAISEADLKKLEDMYNAGAFEPSLAEKRVLGGTLGAGAGVGLGVLASRGRGKLFRGTAVGGGGLAGLLGGIHLAGDE